MIEPEDDLAEFKTVHEHCKKRDLATMVTEHKLKTDKKEYIIPYFSILVDGDSRRIF